MREYEGEELKHRLCRTGVIRAPGTGVREVNTPAVGIKVPTPPASCSRHGGRATAIASPLGAEDAEGVLPIARQARGQERLMVKAVSHTHRNNLPWTQSVRCQRRIERHGEKSPNSSACICVTDARTDC